MITESSSAQLTPTDYDVDDISVVFGDQCDVCFYTLCPSENGSIYAITDVFPTGFGWWMVLKCPRYVILPQALSPSYYGQIIVNRYDIYLDHGDDRGLGH